jgi:hypothetical protein
MTVPSLRYLLLGLVTHAPYCHDGMAYLISLGRLTTCE